MVNVKELYDFLEKNGIHYYAGVPDSQLKPFCDYIMDKLGIGKQHVIAANEGNAVALAAGYHIATGKVGVVYMQNSGLGNAVNPITSLTDPEVYGIPILYMIGWRGQPGIKDEPQHIKQGKITLELLELLGIPYFVIDEATTMADIEQSFSEEMKLALEDGQSVALVVAKNSMEKVSSTKNSNNNPMSREDAIKVIIDSARAEDVIVSTTGKTSREVFEYRAAKHQGHERDFLTVGSMGHASMLASSIAENSTKCVWCLDGDGAMLMHTGSSALIGSRKPENLYHILLNNGAHESVGGMPTIAQGVNWKMATEAFGYQGYFRAKDREELKKALEEVKSLKGPILIEALVNISSREDLGRPTIKPIQNKKDIMTFIGERL